MKNYNIVVLKGDGIGPEIVDEALKVLDAAGEKYGFKFNYDYKLIREAKNNVVLEVKYETYERYKKRMYAVVYKYEG